MASTLAPSKSETDTTPPLRTKRKISPALRNREDNTISTPTFSIRLTYSVRATLTIVFCAPKCFAKSASIKFNLSSSVRQITISDSAIPSSVRRSISVPSPHKASPRSNFCATSWQRSRFLSITFTKSPCFSSNGAKKRPVRPAPIISTLSILVRVLENLFSKSLITSLLPTK